MTRSAPDIAALPADLREGLDRLAADVVGPFGPPPFAQLVEAHFDFLDELRRQGAHWGQVAALLEACGISGDGGTFSAAVVRATYARAAKARRKSNVGNSRRTAAKHSATERNAARHGTAAHAATKRSAAKRGAMKRNATIRSAATRGATKHDEADRDAAERNDVKPGNAAGEELARRFSSIDKPWHTR